MQDSINLFGDGNVNPNNIPSQETTDNSRQSQQTALPNSGYANFQPYAQPQAGYYVFPQGQQPYPGTAYPQQPVMQPVQGQYYMPQFQGYIPVQPMPYPGYQQQVPQQTAAAQPEQTAPESDHTHDENEQGHNQIPKFDEHKYGQLMEIVNDMANGTPPEMSKVVDLMNGIDTQFWKGSVVGAISVFALTNETVKKSAVSMVAKIMNAFGKAQ